jgi:hypothetical protein
VVPESFDAISDSMEELDMYLVSLVDRSGWFEQQMHFIAAMPALGNEYTNSVSACESETRRKDCSHVVVLRMAAILSYCYPRRKKFTLHIFPIPSVP